MSDYILPSEMVTEILIRLPVHSLLRFRCVCREWFTLISSPIFISKHLSHSSSHSKTLVRHYSQLHSKEMYNVYSFSDTTETFSDQNSTRISYPFNKKSRFYLRIVGSCNGLLCLSNDQFGYNDMSVILWNPSIKRAVVSPIPKNIYSRCGPYMFALGFGFVPKTSDYKVVRVAYLMPDKCFDMVLPPSVEVFSLLSGTWTNVKPKFLNKIKSFITEHFWSQAVVGTVVHWAGYKMTRNDKNHPFCNMVMKFDLGSEKFGELGLPEALAHVPPQSLRATILKGSFCLINYDDFMKDFMDETMTTCVIWVMKNYENVDSWTQLYKVDLEGGLGMVLGMKRDGELVLCDRSGVLVTYNCENKEVMRTGICGTKYSFFLDDYVESLVLFGKGKDVWVKKPERDYEDEDENIEKVEYDRKAIILSFTTSMIFRL